MSDKPKHISTGESQITINKKVVMIVVLAIVLFVGGVGWMYQLSATARPATVKTGGYK